MNITERLNEELREHRQELKRFQELVIRLEAEIVEYEGVLTKLQVAEMGET